nr:MAG TPA: minor capsid protein [Caudoviricetes sp.]
MRRTAMLRMANDQYRKVIFNSQVYYNSGAGTYEKAVDMATKDFLSRGINCIQYKNGARVNIASYVGMALRTANTRAYCQGEGAKRQEWGVSTVIVNKRGLPCPKCGR